MRLEDSSHLIVEPLDDDIVVVKTRGKPAPRLVYLLLEARKRNRE